MFVCCVFAFSLISARTAFVPVYEENRHEKPGLARLERPVMKYRDNSHQKYYKCSRRTSVKLAIFSTIAYSWPSAKKRSPLNSLKSGVVLLKKSRSLEGQNAAAPVANSGWSSCVCVCVLIVVYIHRDSSSMCYKVSEAHNRARAPDGLWRQQIESPDRERAVRALSSTTNYVFPYTDAHARISRER